MPRDTGASRTDGGLSAYGSVVPVSTSPLVISGAYSSQASWYVNQVSGSDSAAGDLANPLASVNEFVARMRGRRINSTVKLNIVGNIDAIYLENIDIGPSGFLWIKGTATTVASGTFSARTNLASATNVPSDVTTSTSVAAHVGKRIRSGENVAWIAKDLGASKVRTTPWLVRWDGIVPPGLVWTPVNVAVSDPYVVETLSSVTDEFWIDVRQSENFNIGSTCRIIVEDLSLAANYYPRVRSNSVENAVQFWNCDLNYGGPSPGGHLFAINCHNDWLETTSATHAWLVGGLVTGSCRVQAASQVWAQSHTLFQGASLAVDGDLEVFNGGVAFFDSAGVGVRVGRGGTIFSESTGEIWGSGNATYGLDVGAASRCIYGVKPIVTGATNDARVGGTAKAYAAIPYVEVTNGAAFVLNA